SLVPRSERSIPGYVFVTCSRHTTSSVVSLIVAFPSSVGADVTSAAFGRRQTAARPWYHQTRCSGLERGEQVLHIICRLCHPVCIVCHDDHICQNEDGLPGGHKDRADRRVSRIAAQKGFAFSRAIPAAQIEGGMT